MPVGGGCKCWLLLTLHKHALVVVKYVTTLWPVVAGTRTGRGSGGETTTRATTAIARTRSRT